MPVNDVNNNYSYVTNNYTQPVATTAAAAAGEEAAAAEEGAAKKTDGYVKSGSSETVTYKPDYEKISAMKADMKNNMNAFKTMVQGMFQKQGNYYAAANDMSLKDLLSNITVDAETKAAAQEAISEDGYWGVEATAQRLLEFAQALSGGDPDKFELLKGAVEKGFEAAEQIWGGKLPDISYKTKERTMELFDEWAQEMGLLPKSDVAEED